MRELSLSYVVPDQIARQVGLSAATFTLAGRNLKTWTDWTGVDPESFFSTEQYLRTEQAQVPPLQQFLFALNITF